MPILLLLALLFFIIWGGGFFFFALGNLIHIALIVAIVLVIAHFITARRSAV